MPSLPLPRSRRRPASEAHRPAEHLGEHSGEDLFLSLVPARGSPPPQTPPTLREAVRDEGGEGGGEVARRA